MNNTITNSKIIVSNNNSNKYKVSGIKYEAIINSKGIHNNNKNNDNKNTINPKENSNININIVEYIDKSRMNSLKQYDKYEKERNKIMIKKL